METKLQLYILMAGATAVLAKEPELPLCPTNFQYLPQTLPMHCRMPVNGHPPPFPLFPGAAPAKPQENTQTVPVPPMPTFAKPPGFPPGAMPAFPPGFAMPPGMPMPIPMAGPPQAKLPVIVMPFYSPDPAFKGPAPNLRPDSHEHRRPHKKRREKRRKRRPHKNEDSASSATDTDTEDTDNTESEMDDGYWRTGRRSMHSLRKRRSRKKDFLTPILQYVTKDGYVIYEKQISKGEAKDWLGKNDAKEEEPPPQEPDSRRTSEARRRSAEDDDAPAGEASTRAAPPPPKMQVKLQKTTDIQRFHHHKGIHRSEPNMGKE